MAREAPELLDKLGVLIEHGYVEDAVLVHADHGEVHEASGGHVRAKATEHAHGAEEHGKWSLPGAKTAALSVATSLAVALLGSNAIDGKVAQDETLSSSTEVADSDARGEGTVQSFLLSVASSVTTALLGKNLVQGRSSKEPEPSQPEDDEWWGPARDSVTEAATAAAGAVDAAVAAVADSVSDTAAAAAGAASEAVLAAEAAAAGAASAVPGPAELPAPTAPGMDDADVVLQLLVEPQDARAETGREAGVGRLMANSSGAILGTMAKDGWEVKAIDEEQGLFELSLPAVRFALPMGVVTLPPPRFRTSVRELRVSTGEYTEHTQADMVLQNGKDICTVELGFPFGKTFCVSAAGWGRARIGFEGDTVRISCDIQAGLELPRVPGLRSIMELFVRTYLKDSVLECSMALARAADELADEEVHASGPPPRLAAA